MLKLIPLLLLLSASQYLYSQTIPSYIPQDSLLLWLPFSGNANDGSGNGFNGTVNGAVLTTDKDGNSNSAYDFDGTNDYIDISLAYAPTTSADFTVSIWTEKTSGVIDRRFLVGKYQNLSAANSNFYISSNSESFQIVGNGTNSHTFSISEITTWYHVVVTYSSDGSISTYINGVLEATSTVNLSSSVSSQPFKIASIGNTSLYYDGKIDDIGVWNRVLTAEEITNIYYEGNPPFQLDSNGVTINCSSAITGDTGIVGGVTYTKRTKAQITTSNAATTCTSGITDLSNVFKNESSFNVDINHWDVSSVTNMSDFFRLATSFNQDLNSWDVSNVTSFYGTFAQAYSFNGDISSWDVSSGINLEGVFYETTAFNQDVSSWDVGSATTLSNMFVGNTNFNSNISSWDITNVTNISYMFWRASSFNQDLGSWDVSKITNMHRVFDSATSFNQDLSDWCVPTITSTPGTFTNAGTDPTWGTCPSRKFYGDAGWRLISIPKTGATVSDISDDVAIQGITGGSNTGSTSNFYIYDDTGSWETPSNTTTAWGDGYGAALYFFHNTTNGSATLPIRLDVGGSEPSSDVSVNLNAGSSGLYTLVGNPFLTNYNTNSITATGGSIQNNIQLWTDATGSWTAANRTSGYIVGAWQGFFVETADASVTSITFPTSGKSNSATNANFFSKVADIRSDIAFVLQSEQTYDEAIKIAFRANATTQWDLDDASKMTPLVPVYATLGFATNDKIKSVESLPYQLESEVTLPMQLDVVGTQGEFTLSWDGLESIPEEWQLVLHDYQDGISINLREADTYTFYTESSVQLKRNPLSILTIPGKAISKTTQDNRFAITVQPSSVANELNSKPFAFNLEQNYPNPFNPSTTINYTIAKEGMVELSVFNSAGQQVTKLVNTVQMPGDYNATWDALSVPSGIYFYRLEVADGSMTKKMTLIK